MNVAAIVPNQNGVNKRCRTKQCKSKRKCIDLIESSTDDELDDDKNTNEKENIQEKSKIVHLKDTHSMYIRGAIDNFWECRYCRYLPVKHRARHSVIFSAVKPDIKSNFVKMHSMSCHDNPLWSPQEYGTFNGVTERGKRIKIGKCSKKEMSAALLFAEDKALWLDYDIHILNQLQITSYTVADRAKPGKRHGGINIGFPGLECIHCQEKKFFFVRAGSSYAYTSLEDHVLNCDHCPTDVVNMTTRLKTQQIRTNKVSKVAFATALYEKLVALGPRSYNNTFGKDDISSLNESHDYEETPSSIELNPVSQLGKPFSNNSGSKFIFDGDDQFTTSIEIVVFSQWKLTHFTHSDDKRSSVPLNFPGFQCIHCQKKSFVKSAYVLSVTFYSMQKHLMMCTTCPKDVQDSITFHTANYTHEKKILSKKSTRAMSRNQFIELIWNRLMSYQNDCSTNDNISSPHEPQDSREATHTEESTHIKKSADATETTHTDSMAYYDKPSSINYQSSFIMDGDDELSTPIELVVFSQWKLTYFTQADRMHSRHNFSLNFPGFECAHCQKKTFAKSSDNLYFYYHHMQQHLLSCKLCPKGVQDDIKTYSSNYSSQKKILRKKSEKAMTRNQFIDLIWKRLESHQNKCSDNVSEPSLNEPNSINETISINPVSLSNKSSSDSKGSIDKMDSNDENSNGSSSNELHDSAKTTAIDPLSNHDFIMDGDDQLTTPIELVVFSQWSLTHFTQTDSCKRWNVPLNFPGFECIHCHKKTFVKSADTLYFIFNNMQQHLASCINCPKYIQDDIVLYSRTYMQEKKILRQKSSKAMTRNQFMELIWKRLVSNYNKNNDIPEDTKESTTVNPVSP